MEKLIDSKVVLKIADKKTNEILTPKNECEMERQKKLYINWKIYKVENKCAEFFRSRAVFGIS